jgi:tRNA (Thr-GGU) A37 N-methylase
VLTISPIGEIHTARTDRRDIPVQAAANFGEEGVAVLADGYRDGLDGLTPTALAHRWRCGWFDEIELAPDATPNSLRVDRT